MSKVCLVIVFNHRYEKNIEKLKKIYESRFSLIRVLIPFYNDQENDEIITVYESSHYFEGFFVQAIDKLMKLDVDHYLFVADDLILNPLINENNYCRFFGLDESKRFYIDEIRMLNVPNGINWDHAITSSLPFFSNGLIWKRELPSYDDAMIRFEKFFGVTYKEKYDEHFFFSNNDMERLNTLIKTFYDNNGHSFDIPYPMAMGYSDILAVRRTDMNSFSRLCGIFSAMNMFVEIAIPTAIVLLFDRNEVSFRNESGYTAKLLWEDYDYFLKAREKYQHKFKLFYDDWNENWLYIHPIKLSEWDI